jgi:hypothetical protein
VEENRGSLRIAPKKLTIMTSNEREIIAFDEFRASTILGIKYTRAFLGPDLRWICPFCETPGVWFNEYDKFETCRTCGKNLIIKDGAKAFYVMMYINHTQVGNYIEAMLIH